MATSKKRAASPDLNDILSFWGSVMSDAEQPLAMRIKVSEDIAKILDAQAKTRARIAESEAKKMESEAAKSASEAKKLESQAARAASEAKIAEAKTRRSASVGPLVHLTLTGLNHDTDCPEKHLETVTTTDGRGIL